MKKGIFSNFHVCNFEAMTMLLLLSMNELRRGSHSFLWLALFKHLLYAGNSKLVFGKKRIPVLGLSRLAVQPPGRPLSSGHAEAPLGFQGFQHLWAFLFWASIISVLLRSRVFLNIKISQELFMGMGVTLLQ